MTVAALLTAQLLPAASAATGGAGVEMLMQKAQSLEARGREDLAAQVWQQVLVASPDQPNALAHLARWAKHLGRNEEAAAFTQRLRKVDPSFAEAQPGTTTAVATRSQSKLAEAARLAGNQQYAEAMTIYRELFGTTPPAGALAIAYYETLAATPGGVEPALTALKHLAATYPNVPDYELSIGRLMTYNPATRLAGVTRLSSLEGSTMISLKAKSAWRQALVWEKANPAFAASTQLYLSRYSDADLEGATASMRTAATVKTVAPAPGDKDVQAGYLSLKSGDLAEAKEHFQSAIEVNVENERAHAGLGFVAMKESRFADAVQEFELAKAEAGGGEVRSALKEASFWKTMQWASKALDSQDYKSAASLYQSALAQRPQNNEALSGLGGALLAGQDPGKALPYLQKLVRQQPANEYGWLNLTKAVLQTGGVKPAQDVMASVPASTKAKLAERVEWKALAARLYREAGDIDQSQTLYREVLSSKTQDLPADIQLELASLALQFDQPQQAALYASQAVELAPRKAAAWEVLLSSQVSAHRLAEADRVYRSIPKDALDKIANHPGFQQAVASLKEANGDTASARLMLEELVANSSKLPKAEVTAVKLHLADLDAKLGDNDKAMAILSSLSSTDSDSLAIYRSKILVLNTMKQPNEIVNVFSQAPQSIATALRQDGDVVSVLASAHAATGRPDYAIRLLETFDLQASISHVGAKTMQKLQLGWLLLDAPNSSARLYRLLEEVSAEPALSADARKQVSDLWSTWILRSAEASRKSGDTARALALLEQGAKTYPTNAKLQSAFAGNLLAAGQTKRAFNVYANWGLTEAQPDDYAGAIGAALTVQERHAAEAWVTNALTQWPADAKLLSLAGDLYQAKGDLKHARAYWKEALARKQTQPSAISPDLGNAEVAGIGSGLRTLLVGNEAPARGFAPANGFRSERGLPGDRADLSESPVGVHLSSYEPAVAENSAAALPGLRPSLLLTEAKPKMSLQDSLQDKLAAVESRNTPYISSKMSIWGRGGQAGFSRLLIQQEEFEASTTISNTLRASLLLKPTYLSGGTANGSGDALFGQQTKPAGFGPQSQSGIAGELQLASQSVGVRVGSTPYGFLTNSWIGGVRVQPWNGPITLLLERDNVKDTMLSYSGARDPKSGQIWGGVMSNSATIQGHWGDANSGIYASGGYQVVNGRNVVSNTGFNGNFGTWWKIATLPEGSLTVGMNFSAMHYEKNLRYFTYGQGGYFSPQQYFLFNVPIRWAGTHDRMQYAIGGSIGLQHFSEDESDFYPENAFLQSSQNSRYPALTSTGANFSFDGRLAYQLAPHWLLGAFATASNARNYTATSAGLFVKYTFEERPMSFVNEGTSIPNWRGQDPLQF